MQSKQRKAVTTNKLSAIPNRPEADSIAEGETPLTRYTPGDFDAGITDVSFTG